MSKKEKNRLEKTLWRSRYPSPCNPMECLTNLNPIWRFVKNNYPRFEENPFRDSRGIPSYRFGLKLFPRFTVNLSAGFDKKFSPKFRRDISFQKPRWTLFRDLECNLSPTNYEFYVGYFSPESYEDSSRSTYSQFSRKWLRRFLRNHLASEIFYSDLGAFRNKFFLELLFFKIVKV